MQQRGGCSECERGFRKPRHTYTPPRSRSSVLSYNTDCRHVSSSLTSFGSVVWLRRRAVFLDGANSELTSSSPARRSPNCLSAPPRRAAGAAQACLLATPLLARPCSQRAYSPSLPVRAPRRVLRHFEAAETEPRRRRSFEEAEPRSFEGEARRQPHLRRRQRLPSLHRRWPSFASQGRREQGRASRGGRR